MNPELNLDLSALTTHQLGRQVRAFESVESTNDEVWAWEKAGADHGSVCVAIEQTAGRGRQGRAWKSEPEAGLYVSILLRPTEVSAPLATLSLVTGVVVAEALEAESALPIQLKWPNDLHLHGKKIAGILLERRGDTRPSIVVGIGVNLRSPHTGWGDLLATSLREADAPVERDRLLCAILNRLEPAVEQHAAAGVAPFLTAWRNRCALTGKRVGVEVGPERVTAKVVGVADDGTLLVDIAGGERRALHSGEVHLLP